MSILNVVTVCNPFQCHNTFTAATSVGLSGNCIINHRRDWFTYSLWICKY